MNPSSSSLGEQQNIATAPAIFAQSAIVPANNSTATAIGSGLVQSVEIQAKKGGQTANTGNIFIGFSATYANNIRMLTPGASIAFEAPPGKKINLAQIFVCSVTSGDGAVITTQS